MNTTTQTFDMNPINAIFTSALNSLKKLTEESPKTLIEVLEDHLSEIELNAIGKYITVSEAGKPCKSIEEALCSFNWSATKEGRTYWANICARFDK